MDENSTNDDAIQYYRLTDVEQRNSFKSTWIIINHKIYDVTKFLEEVRVFISTGTENSTILLGSPFKRFLLTVLYHKSNRPITIR